MTVRRNTLLGPDDITRHELANGIVLLVRENYDAHSVVLTGAVQAGSVYDPPQKIGQAFFTAAALLRGTQTRDFAAIYEMLEGNGASLSISGGMHTVGFSGKSLGEDLPLLLDLLADALRRPAFPDGQLERLRGEIVTGLKIREQNARHVADRVFRELAYPGDHPYSRRAEGQVETVLNITREDHLDFHRRHFGPKGMLLVITGAVRTGDVIDWVEAYFGDWQNALQPDVRVLGDISPLEGIHSRTVVLPGKSQVEFVLGLPGPSRFVENWHALNLANNILGVFGMYGRIGAEVRERRGLAYYSYSRLDGGIGPGPWRTLAGVDPANADEAIAAIRGEIRRMIAEPVSEAELDDNKANFIGRLPLRLETNEGVAGVMLMMERYQLGLDYLLRYSDEINAVTTNDILAAVRQYLDPERYALAIAGPELSLS